MSAKTSNGVSFSSLLFLLFLGLKLTDYIDWSWWWVTAPLWAPLTLTVVVLSVYIAIIAFGKVTVKGRKRKAHRYKKIEL